MNSMSCLLISEKRHSNFKQIFIHLICIFSFTSFEKIFKNITAHVHVTEFQKREFPHAHMLIIFEYPKLNYLVAKHMIHGPFGHRNLNNCLMVDEKCKYHYLPPYCNSTIQEVKYLYKYKRHDRLAIHMSHNEDENLIDEIKQFQDIRWAFAQEATKKKDVIRHINTTNPIEGKRYYLMLLMNHVFNIFSRFSYRLLESELNVIECLNEVITWTIILIEIQDEMLTKILLEDYEVELKLNTKQYKVFLKVLDCIQKGKGVSFFIDESSETGKTFLYCALFVHHRSKNLIALTSATSKLLTNIPGGRTTHSHFNIPIVTNESSECTMSKWVCRAIVNMRSRNNLNLSEFLLRVGNNEELINTKGNIKIQKEMNIKRAILVAKNEHVYKLNDKLIFLFHKEVRTFNNYDEVIDDTNNYYANEFLNSLTQNGLSPHKMMLKRNCPIILLRYLDPSNELCNGKKSYAVTSRIIQMISNVGVYLPHPVFSHDQLYIAISRGTPISTLKILIKLDTTSVREKTWTKNVIYRQVSSSSTNIFRLSNISYIINIFLLGKEKH
ncbi:hypothetical protein Pfo_010276 [Paulownia fortunei]|nr:hypothetical protein Pfo_010276 [Paulownia fortunei]